MLITTTFAVCCDVREALSSRLRLLEPFSPSIRLLGLRRYPAALPRGHIDSSGSEAIFRYTDCREKQTCSFPLTRRCDLRPRNTSHRSWPFFGRSRHNDLRILLRLPPRGLSYETPESDPS